MEPKDNKKKTNNSSALYTVSLLGLIKYSTHDNPISQSNGGLIFTLPHCFANGFETLHTFLLIPTWDSLCN